MILNDMLPLNYIRVQVYKMIDVLHVIKDLLFSRALHIKKTATFAAAGLSMLDLFPNLALEATFASMVPQVTD